MTWRHHIRSVAFLGGATVLVKPVWFLFIVAVCPRVLGATAFGHMQTAMALGVLALGLADLGISNHTLREVSRAPSEGRRVFRHVVAYRGVFASLAWAGAVLLAWSAGYEGAAFWSVVAAGGFATMQGFFGLFATFFRAYQKLNHEAVATVAERSATIGLGALALVLVGTPQAVLTGMAVGIGVVVVAQGVWMWRRVLEGSGGTLSLSFLRAMAWGAVPIGLADFLLMAYLRIDQVMVDGMLGAVAAGQYAQAYRILEMLSLIPALAIQAVIFPRLARVGASEDAGVFRRLLRNGLASFAVGGVAVAGALYLVAPALIRLLTGDPAFAPSADVLRVLVWTFPFTCMKDLLYISSLSQDRVRAPILLFGTGLAANVAANVVLLPRFGILGAAYATVGVEVVLVLTLFLLRPAVLGVRS